MKRKLDEKALKSACRKIGLIVLLANEDQIDFDDTREGRGRAVNQIAESFAQEAKGYAAQLPHRKKDPNLAVQAVEYLAHTHAFPRERASVQTYSAMLETIMEIVLQTTQKHARDLLLLDEMESGIQLARTTLSRP